MHQLQATPVPQLLPGAPYFSCCCRKREEAKHKAVALPPAVAKWLKASGAADVALSGISWAKVLQPDKKVSREL
jgi:hypothetical protein